MYDDYMLCKTKLQSRNHENDHGHFHMQMWCNIIGRINIVGTCFALSRIFNIEMELISIDTTHLILNEVQIWLSEKQLGKQIHILFLHLYLNTKKKKKRT